MGPLASSPSDDPKATGGVTPVAACLQKKLGASLFAAQLSTISNRHTQYSAHKRHRNTLESEITFEWLDLSRKATRADRRSQPTLVKRRNIQHALDEFLGRFA